VFWCGAGLMALAALLALRLPRARPATTVTPGQDPRHRQGRSPVRVISGETHPAPPRPDDTGLRMEGGAT
jgi:hypothetical protein